MSEDFFFVSMMKMKNKIMYVNKHDVVNVYIRLNIFSDKFKISFDTLCLLNTLSEQLAPSTRRPEGKAAHKD